MKTFEHLLFRRPRILNLLHRVRLIDPTSQTIDVELEALSKYAAMAQTALEIGSYQGVSADVIASAMPAHGKLYCVDPWAEDRSGQRNPCLEIFERQLRRSGVRHKAIVLRGLSSEVLDDIPPALDFIFVDGDHSWAGIAVDWEIVKTKLRPGGIVCLHDTRVPETELWRTPESVKFYEEVVAHDPQFRLLEQLHSMSVLARYA